jgi:hypothetical protein
MLQVIRPPENLLNRAIVEKIVLDALDGAAAGMVDDYATTVATFDQKPHFSLYQNGRFDVAVGTDDENYQRIVEGVGPHEIEAKGGGMLAFDASYVRKSIVGRIASRPGGSSGEKVFRKRVLHPGFEGTHVDVLITEKGGKKYLELLNKGINKLLPR